MSQVANACMRPHNSTTSATDAAASASSHKGQAADGQRPVRTVQRTTATVSSNIARAIVAHQRRQQHEQPQLLRLCVESATAVRTPTQHIKTSVSGIVAENEIPTATTTSAIATQISIPTAAATTTIITSNTNTNHKPNPNRINLKNHHFKYQSDSYVSAATSTPLTTTTTTTQNGTAEVMLLLSNAKARTCLVGPEMVQTQEVNFINFNSNGLMADAKLVCDKQMICKCQQQQQPKQHQHQHWRAEALKWPCAELEVGSKRPTATATATAADSVPAVSTKSHMPADRHCCCGSTLLVHACRDKRYGKPVASTTIAAATITTTTYLLDILRKLCLVFVLLLSILTLQHANCQQLMPLTVATANTIAATTTTTAAATAGRTSTTTAAVLNTLQTATFTTETATSTVEVGILLYNSEQPYAQQQHSSNNTFTTTATTTTTKTTKTTPPPQAHAHQLPYPHPTKHGPGPTTYINLQVKANDFIRKSTIKEISQQTIVDEEDEDGAGSAPVAAAEKYAEVERQQQQLESFENVVLDKVAGEQHQQAMVVAAAAGDVEVEPLVATEGQIIDIEQGEQLLEGAAGRAYREEEEQPRQQQQQYHLRRKRQLSVETYPIPIPIPIPKPKSNNKNPNGNESEYDAKSDSDRNNKKHINVNNHNVNNKHSDNYTNNYVGNVANVVGHVTYADSAPTAADNAVSAPLWQHYDTTTQIVQFMQQYANSENNDNSNFAADTNAGSVTLPSNSKTPIADDAKNAANVAPKSRQNAKQMNATYIHSLIVFSDLIYNQTNSHNINNNNIKVKNNNFDANKTSSETRTLHKPITNATDMTTTTTTTEEMDTNFAKTAILRNSSTTGDNIADTVAMPMLQQFNQNIAHASTGGENSVDTAAKTVASDSLQQVANVITNSSKNNDDNNSDSDSVSGNDVDDENIQPNSFTDYEDNRKLLRLVMDGLGLQKLPDMKKVNVSQQEYATKYREYLRRVHERKRRELAEIARPFDAIDWDTANAPLHIVSIVTNTSELLQRPRRKRDMHSVSEADADSDNAALIATNFSQPNSRKRQRYGSNGSAARRRHNEKTHMVLHFPLNVDAAQLHPDDIEEANIRLMLIHSPALATKHNSNRHKNKSKHRPCGGGGGGVKHTTSAGSVRQKQVLNLKVYQRLQQGKRLWLDGRKLDIEVDQSRADDTHSQWLQFDVTRAVESWLRERHTNLGLEVQCDNCQRIGARILNDVSAPAAAVAAGKDYDVDDDYQLMPVLNIIGRLGVTYQEMRTRKHSNSADAMAAAAHPHHHNVAGTVNGRQTTPADRHSCRKANQRCCRHTMEVVFKEIKGFEFIIQPKVFDAGYCHGRCPPRFNPAHHHAMLQSLIWKQSRERAPRPCCAPSKLVELEVLHVDEKDSEKLKISTWTDMRVVECACS